MTSQPNNPPHKPLLDQEMFQQLLAAAYTLQEQNDHSRVKLADPDLARKAAQTESSKPPQSRSTQFTSQLARPRATSNRHHKNGRGRLLQSDALFWRAATAVAMASVLALLLDASINRFSPLPAGLVSPPESLQLRLPPREAVLPHGGGIDTNAIPIEPGAATDKGLNEQTVLPDQSPEMSKTHAPARKIIANPHRISSIHVDEGDIVAQNTMVHYDSPSVAPRAQTGKRPWLNSADCLRL